MDSLEQKEENPFEDPVVAKEWIGAIESEMGSSRGKEIYPLLMVSGWQLKERENKKIRHRGL